MASDATSHSRANDFCPVHMTVCKCAHDVLAHAGSADQHECLPAVFLLALSGTCRRRSVPDMPSIMRCLRHTLVTRTSGPACMHCMPTRCPSAVILLQDAGTADYSSARPPDLPTARPAFRPLHALRRQRCAIRYVIFEQFALPVMTKSIVWKKLRRRPSVAD